MSTTYMGYYAPADGADAGTWGSSLNAGFTNYVDQNIGGPLALSLSSSNVLLTASQARQQMIRMTGTLLASVTISPDTGVLWNGFRSFENLTSGSFTITFQNSAGSVTIPQGRRGIVFLDTTNGPRITSIVGSSTADPVPAGTKWAFYQAAAPSGYTQDTSLNDYAFRLVNGTGAGTGGSVNFSTLFATTQVGATALSTAQMPPHTHGLPAYWANGSTGLGGGSGNFYQVTTGASTDSAGSGATHTHSLDMRVKYADFILAARN